MSEVSVRVSVVSEDGECGECESYVSECDGCGSVRLSARVSVASV